MDLPSELLAAVSAPGGGRVALIVGAGCSVEAPTCVPVSQRCSLEVHRRLIADNVLQSGDCSDPSDLSSLADAVYSKTHSQRDVVDRMRDQYDLKLATPNDGYRLAAAMLCEGVLSSVVTLNFDLAMSHALSELGAGTSVGVIENPEDLPRQRAVNIYYLHRNVNAADPNLWVLRSVALQQEWIGHWESIITTKVLTAPVVVFAGLGTPVRVLIESSQLLRRALPAATKLFQVDPANMADSAFFEALNLSPADYIRGRWGEFMVALSTRLVKEQMAQLEQAVRQKVQDDNLPSENVAGLITRLQGMGLIALGKLRASWLLHDKPYCPAEVGALGLIADLLLALGLISRVSGTDALIVEDGLVEFHRGGRSLATYVVASGRGHRGRSAIEAAVERRRGQYRSRSTPPRGVIVGGTSDAWTTAVTPPQDVVRGDVSEDIVAGSGVLPLIHINELRTEVNRIAQVVQ
jgi:hypothetical protein